MNNEDALICSATSHGTKYTVVVREVGNVPLKVASFDLTESEVLIIGPRLT